MIRRHEFEDQDYIHKLNAEEREFLRRFNREFYHADGVYRRDSLHKNPKHRAEAGRQRWRRDKKRDAYDQERISIEHLDPYLRKKLFLSLLLVLTSFFIAGCGDDERLVRRVCYDRAGTLIECGGDE